MTAVFNRVVESSDEVAYKPMVQLQLLETSLTTQYKLVEDGYNVH